MEKTDQGSVLSAAPEEEEADVGEKLSWVELSRWNRWERRRWKRKTSQKESR